MRNQALQRGDYFSLMKSFTYKVQNEIKKNLVRYHYDKKLVETINYFFDKRFIKTCFLKPFLVKLSYDLAGGNDYEEVLPIASAAEFINISSYQSNSSFDHKYGVFDKSQMDNQIIASIITREIADKIISSSKLKISLKEKIKSLYSEANYYMYYGQYYELNLLNKNNLDWNNTSLDDYKKIYLKKCDYISGIFTKNTALSGAVLVTKKNQFLDSLGNFAWYFGIGLNIINDLSDYLIADDENSIPSYKTPVDQFSDIKNGRIFLPVFYLLKKGNDKQRNFTLDLLGNRNIVDLDRLNKLTQYLNETNAIEYTFHIAKRFFLNAKKHLHKIPKSKERDMLSIMASSIRTNKFLYKLRRIQ